MRKYFSLFIFLIPFALNSQLIDSLNTAKYCLYMTAEEREMIYEINRVRSHPRSYLQYFEPMLSEASAVLKKYGKGNKNNSLTTSNDTKDGKTFL